MKEVKYNCGCGYKPYTDNHLSANAKAIEHSKETGHIINGSLTVKTPYLPQRLNVIIKEKKRSKVELLIERSSN